MEIYARLIAMQGINIHSKREIARERDEMVVAVGCGLGVILHYYYSLRLCKGMQEQQRKGMMSKTAC